MYIIFFQNYESLSLHNKQGSIQNIMYRKMKSHGLMTIQKKKKKNDLKSIQYYNCIANNERNFLLSQTWRSKLGKFLPRKFTKKVNNR